MNVLLRSIGAVLLCAAASAALAQATPAGLWKTIDDDSGQEKSLVRISDTAGVFTGKVEKILNEAKSDARCEACSDERKHQPVLGMTILRGVKVDPEDKAVFQGGDILDPNNGKTYRVRLKPVDGGRKLEVRGYIGTPLLGRTQTWIRVE
jgi:uncharacterized protein (DUF2147 family)